MKFFCRKMIAIIVSVGLIAPNLFAQTDKVNQLRAARASYIAATENMSQAEQSDKKLLVNALLTVAGVVATLGAVYLTKELAYHFSKVQSKKSAAASLTSVDLYVAQDKLSAQLTKGEKYMASQLGEEVMPVMQGLFERWKETYVYEIKSVVQESSERAFQVTAGLEKEFVERVTALYDDFMSKAVLDGNTMLLAGENGISSYTKGLQQEFENIVFKEMKAGGSLYAYVNPVRAKAGQTAAKRAGLSGAKHLGSAGKLIFKRSLPLVVLAVALGMSEARASDADLLRRVDINPVLLLEMDDATFEAILQSPELVERSFEVYDTWLRVNTLSAEDRKTLQEELSQGERAAKTLQQKQTEQALKDLSSY